MARNPESKESPSFGTLAKEAFKFSLCYVIKFCYGYLFGSLIWMVIIQPYTKFIDVTFGSYLPEFVFSLTIASIFMSFVYARSVMVLFLPNLIGSATQNYIILIIIIALFTNPITNVAMNAVESARVIGCSLTMSFEQMKEKTKLIMSPIIEVLKDSKHSDLGSIKNEFKTIQQVIHGMRQEAEFYKNQSKPFPSSSNPLETVNSARSTPNYREISNDIQERLIVNLSTNNEIVKKLLEETKLEFDKKQMGLKMSLDKAAAIDLLKASQKAVQTTDTLNMTEIMFENCLGVFRRAKQNCEVSVEHMRQSCQDTVGIVLSAIWCSPLTMSLSSICPWIMNQFVDDNSLCNKMRESVAKIKVDGKNTDINDIYRNLTSQLADLNADLIDERTTDLEATQRIELNIGFNEKTRNIFLKLENLIKFIKDKYRVRKLFYDIFLFAYEIYTTFVFISIMVQACRYQNNYTKQIRFDNYYITGQFFSIDRKRRALGRASVLPLTKDESERYITTFTCKRRTSEEKHTQKASCTTIIVFLAFVLSLLYLDDIFYSILRSIHEHAFIKFREVGHHTLNVEVKGEGSIARLVRSLTHRLNSVYDLDRFTNTKRCLPNALKTSNKFYIEFTYSVLIYFGIDQISIYAMRLRHVTSAFFYPDKEKQRIIFLYSSILLQRERLARIGLSEYLSIIEDDEDSDKMAQQSDDTYTAKDAFKYIYECIRKSISCIRHRRKLIRGKR